MHLLIWVYSLIFVTPRSFLFLFGSYKSVQKTLNNWRLYACFCVFICLLACLLLFFWCVFLFVFFVVVQILVYENFHLRFYFVYLENNIIIVCKLRALFMCLLLIKPILMFVQNLNPQVRNPICITPVW